MTEDNNLVKNYGLTKPYSFSSTYRVQKYYPTKTQKYINELLSKKSDVYSLFRKKKRPKKLNPIYVRHPRQLFQADCIYFNNDKYKRANRGYKFLLVIIDCYTKYVWLRPLKNLQCTSTVDAFKDVFETLQEKPIKLQTDQGKEFKCALMKTFLQENNVFHYFSFGDRKSAIVERVNRTLQNLLYQLLHERKTNKWITLLDELLHIYHNRYHKTIRMTPLEAEQKKNRKKLRRIYKKRYDSIRPQKPVFKVGDKVRLNLSLYANTDENKKNPSKRLKRREYLEQFTNEKFRIAKVNTDMPIPTYRVTKLDTGEPVRGGTFYKGELSLTE